MSGGSERGGPQQSTASSGRSAGSRGGGVFGGGRGSVHTAQSYIYNQLHRQSAMLAYLDIIAALAVFCALMIPLVLLIGKIKPPADGPAMH